MNNYMKFSPDIIVETTSVCDRACVGCYAPNVVSKESADKLYKTKPELFLSPDALKRSLLGISPEESISAISFRGGEPSRHPQLVSLLQAASRFGSILFIETHGRWILSDSESSKEILNYCATNGCFIKLSFDKMHGLSPEQLKAITNYLDILKINFAIAITESTEKEFHATRTLCSWIPNEKIIYQLKAKNLHDLIKPRLGIVRVSGLLSDSLNTKLDSSMTKNEGVA